MNIFYMKQKRVGREQTGREEERLSVDGKRVTAWVINLTIGHVIYEG